MRKISMLVLGMILTLFALPILLLIAASFVQGDLMASLKGNDGEILFTLSRWRDVFADEDMMLRFQNSLKITGYSLLFQIPVGLLGGLFLARSHGKGAKILLVLMLLMLLLPFQSIMVPVFRFSKWAQLYDTHLAVILLQAFAPLGPLVVWLLIRQVPQEQWEAALIDCSSQTKIFFRAILPQLIPGLAVLVLLCFAESWNLIEQPLILLHEASLLPASMALNDMKGSAANYAGAVMYSLPILILYVFAGTVLYRTKNEVF